MTVTRISVSAQRKVPHPCIDYATLSSLVTLDATLGEGDDARKCAARLQLEADAIVLDHISRCVADLTPRSPTDARAARLAEKHGGGK